MFPSALRCISLVQPAHIPSRCPFQNMAGERKKERDRKGASPPSSIASGSHLFQEGSAAGVAAQTVESAQNLPVPSKVAGKGTGANARLSPSLHSILLQDLGQIAHPIFAPIYSSYHGWCPLGSSASLVVGLSAHLSLRSLSPQVPGHGPEQLTLRP